MSTHRLGVFLWTEYTHDDVPLENKLHLGQRDDPLGSLPDELNAKEAVRTMWRIISHVDRYDHVDELPSVEATFYRKLGELTVKGDGEYVEYHDSPPAINDAGGVFVREKPKYSHWRQRLV